MLFLKRTTFTLYTIAVFFLVIYVPNCALGSSSQTCRHVIANLSRVSKPTPPSRIANLLSKVNLNQLAAERFRRKGDYSNASRSFELSGNILLAAKMAEKSGNLERAIELHQKVTSDQQIKELRTDKEIDSVKGIDNNLSGNIVKDPYLKDFFDLYHPSLLEAVLNEPHLKKFISKKPSRFNPLSETNETIWREQFEPSKTEIENDHIAEYRGTEYDRINTSLRNARHSEGEGWEVSSSIKESIQNLMLALSHRPIYNGYVFRKTTISDRKIRNSFLKKGNKVSDASFLSTAYDGALRHIEKQRAFWANDHSKDNGLIMIIRSTTGRSVESKISNTFESEVIFFPETPLEVVGVVYHLEVPLIFLQEVPRI